RRNGINADATYDRRTEIRTPAELQIVLGDRLVDVVDREPAVEVARGFERIPRQIERRVVELRERASGSNDEPSFFERHECVEMLHASGGDGGRCQGRSANQKVRGAGRCAADDEEVPGKIAREAWRGERCDLEHAAES